MNFNIKSLLVADEENAEEMNRVFNVDNIENLDYPDVNGLTLLHYSVIYGQKRVMQYLINNNCDVNAQDLLGRTPLMLALKGKDKEIMQALLAAGADMFLLNHKSKSALHKFFKEHSLNLRLREIFLPALRKRCCSSEEMAQKMFDAGCNIYQAAFTKDAKIIEYMLKLGLPIDSVHPEKQTTALHVAVMLDDVESVKILLKYGIDANALSSAGFNSLHYVYFTEHTVEKIKVLKILLDHGVSPMLLTPEGDFQIKRTLMNGNAEAINTILQSNIDFTAKDVGKNNILHYLAANTNSGITKALKIHINKFNVNEVNELGSSPLYESIRHINVEMVKFLLDQNAEANCVNHENHYTPLFRTYALVLDRLDDRKLKQKLDSLNDQNIELLLQHKADPQYIFTRNNGRLFTIFDMALKVRQLNRAKPVIAHLAMLEELGTPITEIIRSKINSQARFREYFTECKEILNKNIVKSVSILKLLTVNKKKMAQYVGNGRLILKLKRLSCSQQVKSSFPYYCNTLSKRLRKGIEHRRLRHEVAGIISTIFEDCIDKTDLIVDKTIDYLDDEALRQLSKLQELMQ